MVDFKLIDALTIPFNKIPNKELDRFVAHWNTIRGDRPFPGRSDFDPVEIPTLLKSIRLVDIEGGGIFRFRLYSPSAVIPDSRDMTGLTTNDYRDTAFGALVTRHYAKVAKDGVARCWHIKASVDTGEYEYLRVVLPLSREGDQCDMLLVNSSRSFDPFAHAQ